MRQRVVRVRGVPPHDVVMRNLFTHPQDVLPRARNGGRARQWTMRQLDAAGGAISAGTAVRASAPETEGVPAPAPHVDGTLEVGAGVARGASTRARAPVLGVDLQTDSDNRLQPRAPPRDEPATIQRRQIRSCSGSQRWRCHRSRARRCTGTGPGPSQRTGRTIGRRSAAKHRSKTFAPSSQTHPTGSPRDAQRGPVSASASTPSFANFNVTTHLVVGARSARARVASSGAVSLRHIQDETGVRTDRRREETPFSVGRFSPGSLRSHCRASQSRLRRQHQQP
jgi:hypothetical protein